MSNNNSNVVCKSRNKDFLSARDILPPLRRTSQCPSASDWRRDAFIELPERSTTTKLHEHVTELALNNKEKFLNLKEILAVVQEVWKPRKSNLYASHTRSKLIKKMNESDSKSSNSNSSRDMPSPIFRRRLSAPETIMRKHVLAQQRVNLHDDIKYETNISNYNTDISGGSYPNLSRRKDCDYMRKSTLLRRLWSNNKLTFSSKYVNSYYEWQHLFGKSTNSLYSNYSSSEQLLKTNSRKTSPQHNYKQSNYKKVLTAASGKSKQNLNEYSKQNFDNNQYSSNPNLISHKTSTTISPKTISSEENTQRSTYTPLTDENSINGNNNTKIDMDSSSNNDSYNYFTRRISDTSTQTADVTNLNVISNIKLSDATLDMIFNRVMDDVNKSVQINNANPSPTSFYLSTQQTNGENSEHSRIVKCMIGTGSPYCKPPEVPQVIVPRYSALPRTTSMEVNISSGDSDEKDDDSLSFVDSLEDVNSPRLTQTDNLSPLLPDNSERKKSQEEKRSSSFFIPIENENGSNNVKQSALTELLPGKVKEKLIKRQQIRTEKQNNNKLKHDNTPGNNYEQYRFIVDTNDNLSMNNYSLPKINNKQKKKIKPVLPKLKTIRRIKEQEQNDNQVTKDVKRKCLRENNKTSNWILKEKLSPITTTEQSYNVKTKSANKNNKRIEILEVMECLDTNDHTDISVNKSKIPVLITKKSAKTSTVQKPTYLDNDNSVEIIDDPKLDQLIANILIDTLNNGDGVEEYERQANKIKTEQKFEMIPEEPLLLDKCNSNIENGNINNNNESSTSGLMAKSKKCQPGGGVLNQNQCDSTIPSGWITFYLLHKHDISPDSTSDEGKKLEQFKQTETKQLENDYRKPETVLPPIQFNNTNMGTASPFSGEWSVTLTASNVQQQIVPNIEMKLKFTPSNGTNNNSHSDSGIGEDSTKKCKNSASLLPLIQQNKCIIKRKMMRYNCLEPIKLHGPKQTRTSTNRYFLSRSNIYQFSQSRSE